MTDKKLPFVWLASYPKSGNTWVRLFLAAMKSGNVDPNDMPRSSCFTDTTPYYYNVVAPCPLSELDEFGVLSLRPAVLQHLMTNGPWPLLIKTHNANVLSTCCGPLIPKELTAGIIYLVRDPRDIAVSLSSHGSTSIDKAIERICNPNFALGKGDGPFHLVADWSTHVRSYTVENDIPVLVVRYEDMVAKAREAFERILDFLEVDGRRYFNDALNATSFGRLKLLEQAEGFREAHSKEFFRSGKVGDWTKVLSKDQEQTILSRHGDMMRDCGYL